MGKLVYKLPVMQFCILFSKKVRHYYKDGRCKPKKLSQICKIEKSFHIENYWVLIMVLMVVVQTLSDSGFDEIFAQFDQPLEIIYH